MAFGSPPGTGFRNILAVQTTLTPAAVLTITSAEQTFTVPGIPDPALFTSIVLVSKPTAQAGLIGPFNARASAANQIGISFGNPTVASITPTAGEIYNVVAMW